MVTTIQIDEETQRRLFQIITKIQAETGRRVSYDEALNILMRRDEKMKRARLEFSKFRGILHGDKNVWRELRNLRKSEDEALERKLNKHTRPRRS